ncbi:MAG: aminotransferase class I/II-fold pyridoxal phosphate-dependent enzyme [Cytophagales bacterium]|nr:MAG: aminotransferase class I/II-fold pyridoxal phosphate-dependent enzyme [Cytophagales bacterium]TAF60090.1 MAG: aminotransferase class I/II-fold pyridoxal phosphate-dependent enzyme [Cytophagales bacterium]
MSFIDFRSDTVTLPTPAMREAMAAAELGDNVYGEDKLTSELESRFSALFGHAHAVFCPSGTMANQIALGVLTRPRDEIICAAKSHIYCYEGGGWASHSAVSLRLIASENGKITAQDVLSNINADDVHFPRTSAVALENTVNRGGGCYYTLQEVTEIQKVCRANGLGLHLDGARLFNALVASDELAFAHGQCFDTISVCLSKGLGAPVGSVLLLRNAQMYKEAMRMRKMMGGGMRQIGMLAAAGLYALENHVQRLKEDHDMAQRIVKLLNGLPFVSQIMPCYTNIVLFDVNLEYGTAQDLIAFLGTQHIRASAINNSQIRFVTHLSLPSYAVERLETALQEYAQQVHTN